MPDQTAPGSEYEDKSGAVVPGDELSRTAEEIARDKQAEDTQVTVDLEATPDPTGATDEQLAVKAAANQLGDQDAVNLAGRNYPPGAEIPSALTVRRYPELFDQAVIDSYQTDEEPPSNEPELPRTTEFENPDVTGEYDGTNDTDDLVVDGGVPDVDPGEDTTTHITSS